MRSAAIRITATDAATIASNAQAGESKAVQDGLETEADRRDRERFLTGGTRKRMDAAGGTSRRRGGSDGSVTSSAMKRDFTAQDAVGVDEYPLDCAVTIGRRTMPLEQFAAALRTEDEPCPETP